MVRVTVCGLLMSVAALAATPTFNKDVLPILQKHCQGCHRPGRNRAHVAAELYGSAAVGQGDEGGGGHAKRCRRGSPTRSTVTSPMTAG